MMKQALVLLIGTMLLAGCSNSGVQGTNLISSFKGLTSAEVISPTSIKLQWSLDSDYKEYKIYQNFNPTPIKRESFSSSVIAGLSADTTYTYKVTGLKQSGEETDFGGASTVTTWAHFMGLTAGGVTLKGPTEVTLTWVTNSSKTNFQIFYKKKTGTWTMGAPAGAVTGNNTFVVSGLTASETYCFYIRAAYTDGSIEPTATTDAAIDATAPCIQMTSQMANLPSVTVYSKIPGPFPSFWTSNGNADYKTEIYEMDTDTRVASINGNGTGRAFVRATEGHKNYYALVSYQTQVARVPVNIAGRLSETSVAIRTLNSSGTRGPIYPPLINGGKGVQELGTAMAAGDFNCDGIRDLAVSMPKAVLTPSPLHYNNTGAVIVYYGYQPTGCLDGNGSPVPCPIGLKTDVTPSIANNYPNPVLVTYPADSDNMNIGAKLSRGNFNGDCYQQKVIVIGGVPTLTPLHKSCNELYARGDQTSTDYPQIRTCDDLVIGVNDNSFYVAYGDPTTGLVTGSNAASSGLNEFTCDAFSNTCRVVRMTAPTGYTSDFGTAFTVGDYNNDGFDDLAATARNTTSLRNDVLVYRGGPQGLYPKLATGDFANIISAGTSPSPTAGITTYGSILSTDDFATSLGSVYDSRKCINGFPTTNSKFNSTTIPLNKGYDFTKCDDLIVGAPGRVANRGSVFSCKATIIGSVNGTDTDPSRISAWACSEHYPTDLGSDPARYGQSILGIRNFNGFPVSHIESVSPSTASDEKPSIAGALFVGAPTQTISGTANAGAVYGYYVTPLSQDYTNGGIQAIMNVNQASGGHPVQAVNITACNRTNTDIGSGAGNHCRNQRINMQPPENGVQFGTSLGNIAAIDAVTPDEQYPRMLAVGAPYRTILTSGNTQVSGAGSIYLYKADVSTFEFDNGVRVTTPKRTLSNETSTTCTLKCTWYAGGLSPFGPNIFYPSTLTKDAHFGLGNIVGGSFNNDEEGDLVAAAPQASAPTPGRGAVYIFNSSGGFGPSENTASKVLNPSLALEGNYRFHEGKSVGDINGDGYADMVTHINANGKWSVVIYYGSTNGLITTPTPSVNALGTQPLILSHSTDILFGQSVYPVGDTNGDGFADLLIIGNVASYLYYGSSSGLVTAQEPVVSPIGKGALKFALKTTGDYDLFFSPTMSWSDARKPSTTSYNSNTDGAMTQGAVTYGDFNKDGYGDFAIRMNSSVTPATSLATGGQMGFTAQQTSRVIVFYGSIAGPQVNRLTGRVQVKSNASTPIDVVVQDPCSPVAPFECKIQMLGAPHSLASTGFGYAMETVHTLNSATSPQFDRILVGDYSFALDAGTPSRYEGAVYIFDGSLTGLKPVTTQTLVPQPGAEEVFNQRFGAQIINAGDINGDQFEDIVISSGLSEGSASPPIYVFYGAAVGGTVGYYGATSIADVNFWNNVDFTPAKQGDNSKNTVAGKPRPQLLKSPTLVAGEQFGFGLSAIGDFNNDGYADIAINVPNQDSTLNGLVDDTGSVIVMFGSATGLQGDALISPYPRCYGGVAPVCDSLQVYVPDAIAFENTSIGPQSAGDFNGDGYKDLAIGGAGRNLSISGGSSATSTGVIYILY